MGESSLVLSLRDQPRQVGEQTERTLQWEVPEGWKTEVAHLTPGQQIPVTVQVISMEDGVYVQLQGAANLESQCVRCLEDVSLPTPFHYGETFVEEESVQSIAAGGAQAGVVEVTGDVIDEPLIIERDTVNIEPLLRDAILGQVPFQPLCSVDCLGICEHCGILLKDAGPNHKHEFLDPRFAELGALVQEMQNSDDEG